MSKLVIDINPEEAQRTLTVRERVGLALLLVMFRIVFPARYSHQLDNLDEMFSELKK